MVPGAVRVAAEVLDQPVVYAWSGMSIWEYLFKRDVELSDGIKSFA